MAHKTRLKKKPNVAADTAVDSMPLHQRSRGARYLPWVTGAIAFLVYLSTMTPAMQMGDGTELATAAYVLGVPHPTGYPLYMLLAKFWLIITMTGDVIMRTTLLNALLMAAAVGVSATIFVDLLRAIWKNSTDKTVLIWAAAGSLTVAFLRFHWSNAVVTEVYALQFLLTVCFTRAAMTLDLFFDRNNLAADGPPLRTSRPYPDLSRYILWSTIFLALALAHHRLSITLILPWAALFWVGMARRAVRSPWDLARSQRGVLWRAALIIAVGLSLYAYLPIRAAIDPPVNWGNPDSWSRFYNHVRGTEYLDRGLLKPAMGKSFSAETLARFTSMQTTHLAGDLAGQFAPFPEDFTRLPGAQKIFLKSPGLVILLGFVIAGLATWGFARIWLAGRRVVVGVIVAIAAQNIAIIYAYNIADIRDYFLYPFWAAWVGLFIFIAWLVRNIATDRRLVAGYAALLIPLCVLAGNWGRVDRSDNIAAELLSATILSEDNSIVPQDSILITGSDSDTFTTWYRQIVRGDRPDVLNFAGNFVYMPWYKTFFSEQERRDYQLKFADGVAFDAAEYTRQLRNGIIDANINEHPIFTSINDGAVLNILAKTYTVEPVDAMQIMNRRLFDEATTTVLYRIRPKGRDGSPSRPRKEEK